MRRSLAAVPHFIGGEAMIVILKQETPNEKRDQLVDWLKKQGFGVDVSEGEPVRRFEQLAHDLV